MIYDELAYVVDDNDNIIATKERGKVLTSERVRIVSVWVENDKNEVLIAKRSSSMPLDPGLWGPSAAGGVKVGSNYEQTALEEVAEEIGLKVHLSDLIPKGKMVYETKKNGKRMCAVFTVKSNRSVSQFTTEPTEVDEIKWISKNDLVKDIKQNPEKYLASAELWRNYLN